MAVNVQSLADIAYLIAKNDFQSMVGVVDILHDFRHLDVCAYQFGRNVFV